MPDDNSERQTQRPEWECDTTNAIPENETGDIFQTQESGQSNSEDFTTEN